MRETTNYKLKIIDVTDALSPTPINDNANIIDIELKKMNDVVQNIELTAEKVSIKDTGNHFASNNVEGALSELFQNASNGKQTIATSVGSPLLANDTFGAMGTKIDTLTQKFKTNLNLKGVTATDSDKMSNLIDKVGSIITGKRWASGSVVSSNAISTTLKYASGSTVNGSYCFCSVNSLSFTPSYVLITEGVKHYPNKIGIYSDISVYGKSYILSSYYQNTTYEASHATYVEYGELSVFSNGFKFPVASGNVSYNWIAFE